MTSATQTQTFKFWKTIVELSSLAVRTMSNELTDEEKKSIAQEAQELKAKLKTITDTKEDNSRKLINASTNDDGENPMLFEVGVEADQRIAIGFDSVNTKALDIDKIELTTVKDAENNEKLIKQAVDIMNYLNSEISTHSEMHESYENYQKARLTHSYQLKDSNHKLCTLKFYQSNVEKVLNTMSKFNIYSLSSTTTDQYKEKIDSIYQSQLSEISNISSKITQDMLLAAEIVQDEYLSPKYLGLDGTNVRSMHNAADATDKLTTAKLKIIADISLTKQNLIKKIDEDNCNFSLESEIAAEQALLQIEQEELLDA